MHISNDQRLALLKERLEEIDLWRDRSSVDLQSWTFDEKPLEPGAPWPDREGVRRLELREAQVPLDWDVRESRLELDVGGEGLVTIRYPNGDDSRFGLDAYHRLFPLNGKTFDVEIDAVARLLFGEPNRNAHLGHSRLVWLDVVVDRLARRLRLILETVRTLGVDPAVDPLLLCAEAALNRLQWPSSTSAYVARSAPGRRLRSIWELPDGLDRNPPALTDDERASVQAASDALRAELESLQNEHRNRGALAVTGHAHLDLAWLWPMDETRRKAVRTYHTATDLMDRYPEFQFNQSSAQLYAFVEEDDPNLFSKIEQRVDSGRWEPIGGMWVEPDTVMPCGESLVRQLLYGQRYFKEKFGSYHTVCWLPDCFGFSAGLPQLLVSAGVKYFFTYKMNWSETNRFPYDLFWWEGSDGSRVLAHGFDNPAGYNGDVTPDVVVSTWENFRGKSHYRESLLSIGWGDGGGGPTDEMLERARELEFFPTVPSLRFTTVQDFFQELEASVTDGAIPVWVGEMHLELHRGTLTTQGRVKYLHRRAERDLIAAEALGAINALTGGPNPRSLEEDWKVLLRNQFHDILPGSSIREVYVTAEEELHRVVENARRLIDEELRELAELTTTPGDRDALLVFNPDLSQRVLQLEFDGDLPGAQRVDGGSVLTADETIGGLEAKTVVNITPSDGLDVSTSHLENEFVRVEFDATGTLARVFDKRAGRDLLTDRGNQLWAYVDKPRAWDAWDIDASYTDSGEEITASQPIEIIESGPHRVAVRIRRRFRNSEIDQDVRLWSNSPRIEFKTTLNWGDRRWLLKARFPLAIRSNAAVFESAFGTVERLTHRNTSWQAAQFEVSAHRFVDLSEPGFGVALLNDGKYGHHVVGNEVGISLLRSPIYPDPLADEGRQTFTYALFPHAGSWQDGGVLGAAEDLNRPLLARRVAIADSSAAQPLRVRGLGVGLGALKAVEDGDDILLRCYEPGGGRGEVTVELPAGWSLEEELDLLERPLGPPDCTFTPFKVHSWRIAPTGAGGSHLPGGPSEQ
jgi:alpha-mannosidase